MIRQLTIRDFVLVEALTLSFLPGFGALTGETGAGKSILLDALSFALGARAEAGWVRHGAKRAEVTAAFDWPTHPEAQALLSEWAIEPEAELLIRRLLDESGRSRGWIQGMPAAQAQLRALGAYLVDIHGQHAHHALLSASTQRRLLDRFAEAQNAARAVAEAYQAWQQAQAAFAASVAAQVTIAEERERLTWWLAEWEEIAFTPEAWQEWQTEHRRLAHTEELKRQLALAHVALAEEAGVFDRLAEAQRALQAAEAFQPTLAEPLALLASAEAEIAEAAALLKRQLAQCEEDPERLAWLEGRLAAVHHLARKHRTAPEALPALAAAWQQRLASLEAADLDALRAAVAAAEADYRHAAAALSAKRRVGAERLQAAVNALLPELAMPHAAFAVALIPAEPSPQGDERVVFRFAANPGQLPAPLAEVASGGELSRIGLAIQVVASQAEEIETLIFDEVDVGVSGPVAAVVGRMLQEVGHVRQVLVVTHQPQVAAAADWQWQVRKEVTPAGTRTVVTALTDDERIAELARMVAGEAVSNTALAHAAQLLAEGRRVI